MPNKSYVSIDDKPFSGEEPTKYLEFKYPLDNFQLWGCKAIDNNENVLATAHTGSGKTTLALYAIAKCLQEGKKVIYTSPIKTLSNQKYKEFSSLFPDKVGIITGDIKTNPTADCLIMTAEILRNSLLRKTDDTIYEWNFNPEEVAIVILDEVHFINNQERGKVWEEIIINLSSKIRLVMLSATISGAIDMVEWIGNLKQVICHLVSTFKRPVPLKHCIYWNDELHTVLENDNQWNHLVWSDTKKDMDKYFVKNHFNNRFFHKCLDYLKINNLMPTTVFLLNREAVENQAKTLPDFVEDSEQAKNIKGLWEKHLHKYKNIYEHTEQWNMLYDLVMKGIGIHHSGMIPILKEIVEILYDKGLIKVLLATETFAMGVNMPTKTVIFTNVTKFDGNTRRTLKPEEYGQMAGRAGRRGIDTKGLVVILPFLNFINEGEAKSILLAPPQKISSKLSLDYSIVLKLLNYKIDIGNINDPIIFILNKFKNSLFNEQDSKQLGPLINEKKELEEKLKISNLDKNILLKKEKYDRLLQIIEELKPQGYFRIDKKLEKKLLMEKKELEGIITQAEIKILDNYKNLENINNNIELVTNKMTIHINYLLEFLKDKDMIDESFKPTMKGRIIAEVNECNPLVMGKIIENNIFDDLTFPEIVGLLSIFVADKDKEEMFISDLDITEKEKKYLMDIDRYSKELYDDELKLIQKIPFTFNSEWAISLNMIEVIKEWSDGKDWFEIKNKFNNFEGNFIKNVLRLTNVIRNIESIAKLLNNVKLINKLNGFQEKLIRDVVITDSLYI